MSFHAQPFGRCASWRAGQRRACWLFDNRILFSAPAIIFLPRMDEGDHADLDHCRRRSSWSLQNQLIDLKGSIGFVWPK